jgi:hypothetical protein
MLDGSKQHPAYIDVGVLVGISEITKQEAS